MYINITGFRHRCVRLGKSRRTDVREISVSRYHGDPTEKPSEHYRIERFKGALNWAALIMPRDTSVSSRTVDVIFPVWTAIFVL